MATRSRTQQPELTTTAETMHTKPTPTAPHKKPHTKNMSQKLTIKQTAQLWGCSTRTIYRRINNGTLPHEPGPTLGSGPLINKHDALQALKNPNIAPRPYIRKTKDTE